MAFSYQNNGNGTATITATYTATKAKVDVVLDDAAHALFDLGYGNHGTDGTRLWAAVSNQEKFDMLNDEIKRTLVDRAKAYHVHAGEQTARTIAIGELGNYDI